MTRRLEVLLLAVILLVCIACAGTVPRLTRAADQDVELVDSVWHNPHADLWRASGWSRSSTPETPSRIVISVGRHACIMAANDVNEPWPRNFYHCRTPWLLQSAVTNR